MDFQVPNTLAEQITNFLANRIMTGAIRPGQRLHEATIATELKVSRASVKEAFYTLERWHLIDITPRKGACATQMDAERASELYDVYTHLLMMLTRRVCERWQENDRERLVAQVEKVIRSTQGTSPDVSDVVQASFDVMDIFGEVVGNPYLTEALANFKPAVSRPYYLCADRYRQDLDRTGGFFSRLMKAIIDRDSDEAQRQTEAFANHQKRLIHQALAMKT